MVTLSVVDDDGDTGTAQVTVTAFDPDAVATVEFGAMASVNVNSNQPAVSVPGSVQAGDLLVLIGSFNRTDAVVTGPAGWTLLDSAANSTASSQTHAWTKVATAADAGATVQLSLSAYTKTSLQLASYSAGTAPGSAECRRPCGCPRHVDEHRADHARGRRRCAGQRGDLVLGGQVE